MKFKKFLAVASTALALSFSATAPAQQDQVILAPTTGERISNETIRTLKPVVNPLKAPDTTHIVPDAGPEPHAPGVMTEEGPDYFTDYDDEARAFGSFGIPYTATRVQLGPRRVPGVTDANLLSTAYPYRTVGKLTFSAGYCSASVIRRSVIVTAAHCIQNFGSGNTIFSNFQFTPGHYGAAGATLAQSQPYGRWNAWSLVRPATWANGTDTGCGAARDNDLAVIALRKNASGQFIGDRVGRMSYGWNNYSFVSSPKTGNLRTAAMTTLGYPGLLDRGRIMQRVDGPAYTTTVCRAGQIWAGGNFTRGSSGGPWVVNFRGRDAVRSGGAVPGQQSVMAVVGVTSWGAADPNNPKDNYSSQFRQNPRYPNANYGGYGAGNIGSLLSTLCNGPAPEGGTLAARGYCNP